MSRISQKQIHRLQQKLSPQQIQMIKLLELPVMQLQNRIKEEMEQNPVLEEAASEEREEMEEEQDKSLDDYLKEEEEASGYKYRANNYSKDDRQPNYNLTEGRSLGEHLVYQIGFRDLSEHQLALAKYIIGSLDSDGYLRRELSALADDVAFSLGVETDQEELEAVLREVQQMEPAGVAARSLQESLQLQIKRKPIDTPARVNAEKILDSYFNEFSKKHYDKLMSRLGITVEQFREAIGEIVALSPKPGGLHSEGGADRLPYIIPDFILENRNGEYELRLNSGDVPQVRLSRHYVDMVKDMAANQGGAKNEEQKETIQFVRKKLDSAKWFILAIRQRQDTLMRTMTEIYKFQREYFDTGDMSLLRPMILKDIADRTNLDVSTISRVVNSKYIQTPIGIVSLKELFSEAMQTEDGKEVSSYEIKSILEECIENEDKSKPMTDEALVNVLNGKGYKIARRTVAKYREMLGIPVARLRKEI